MEITHDRKNRRLWLSQERYVERILERFNMKEAKPVNTPLGGHFKLSKRSCPSTEEKNKKMVGISYSSVIGSLMMLWYVQAEADPLGGHVGAVGPLRKSKKINFFC